MSTPRRPRATLVPNANNPGLLLRLVRLLAAGHRAPRALAELLDVEVRTVHYYTQAGEWLGLIETDGGVPRLTRRGLELAFSPRGRQRRLYAEAVWRTPLVRALMAGRRELPDNEEIAAFILEREPEMSPATAARRATALRGLVGPALDHRPRRALPAGEQLHLPFLAQAPVTTPPGGWQGRRPVDLRAGTEDNPEVYARLLHALLDHGELSLGQVRAVLDASGAQDGPIGAYAEMAVRRGDAVRVEDRLVATAGAARRRALVEDGLLVALTDPDYRAYLALLRDPAVEDDPRTLRDLSALSARFAHWDRRWFGLRLTPDSVERALAQALPGRSLDGLPVAGATGAVPAAPSGPFLDHLDERGVAIAFPSALAGAGAVGEVNRLLAEIRVAPAAVRPPTAVDRRLRVHGGLLAPGELPPRAVPDNLSLRLRALSRAPALALLAALLLLDRQAGGRRPVRLRGGVPAVRAGSGERPVVDVFARLARERGWTALRPPRAGEALLPAAEAMGIAVRLGRRIVLDEALFSMLRTEPEAEPVAEGLARLAGLLEAVLDAEEMEE